jgi:quinol monooxygenase YgiN
MNSDQTIIVAGTLTVDPSVRDTYLARSAAIVEQARAAEGCLDFSITADLLEPERINLFEHWTSREALDAFRSDGPEGDQATDIVAGDVREYRAIEEVQLL